MEIGWGGGEPEKGKMYGMLHSCLVCQAQPSVCVCACVQRDSRHVRRKTILGSASGGQLTGTVVSAAQSRNQLRFAYESIM